MTAPAHHAYNKGGPELPGRLFLFYACAMRFWLCLLLLLANPASARRAERPAGAILIYSGTTGYRHESIPAGIEAVKALAAQRGLQVEASEDPSVFAPASLARFRAVVLLSATTDPKDPASEWPDSRRDAFQRFVESGGAIVAVHAAADSHYHWPWYGKLIGGRFARHPPGTPAGSVALTDPRHPANHGLAVEARRVDEWYYFDDFDPRSTLLATVDPQSIGEPDANPNPAAWTRRVGSGRVFYTAMGHTVESYSEPWFLRHLGNGIDWVLARQQRKDGR